MTWSKYDVPAIFLKHVLLRGLSFFEALWLESKTRMHIGKSIIQVKIRHQGRVVNMMFVLSPGYRRQDKTHSSQIQFHFSRSLIAQLAPVRYDI